MMNEGLAKIDLPASCDTVPKLLLDRAARLGERVALRHKDFGIWQSLSWRDYRQKCRMGRAGP